MTRAILLAAVVLIPSLALAADAPPVAKKVRVLIWDERQPSQKQAYGEQWLGEAIAAHLAKNPAFEVRTAGMPAKGQTENDPALTDESLDKTDVLIWWGHVRQREVPWATADRVVERIKAGKLALVALHSAHWASPFVRAMNAKTVELAVASLPEAERANVKLDLKTPSYTAVKRDTPLTPTWAATKSADGTTTLTIHLPICVFPAWAHDGKPGHMTTLAKAHPIAAGLPEKWDVKQTEMYDEPFHVPAPDVLVFEEAWDAGQRFRSGMVWNVGKGRVFYFRPGHETYPVYREELPLKVIENAVGWLGR